jgi:2-oxo-4-hydroxy-4-carboxy--5-ureidoimidazoline (OHCU) decarboxylase
MARGPAATWFEQLNAADETGIVAMVGPLFEQAPRFLARLWAARPFEDRLGLFREAREIALAMPEDEQRELLEAHPRIGAAPETISAYSHREQGYPSNAARARGPGEEGLRVQAELDRLNAAYEARFGFRFVVFVAGRPRSEMIRVLERRLRGNPAAELTTALRDVVAIAEDRWRADRAREAREASP